MRILVDTSRLTEALRGDAAATAPIEEADEVWVPFVTLGEIKAGFLGGDGVKQAHNEALLGRFFRLPRVGALYADRETTEVYARLYVQLRDAGTPIPANDLWIASLAVQHQLGLMTRDSHFAKVPQVSIV